MKRIRAWVVILAAVTLSGCYETKQDYTINPDGSGKVVVEVTMAPGAVNPLGGAETAAKSPDESARDLARDLVKESTGIETWTDVSFKPTADGRAWFKGTAYFRSLTAVELHNIDIVKPAWSIDAKGRGVLELTLGDPKKPGAAVTPVALTDAEVAAAIQQERANYQQGRAMMSGLMTGLKVEQVYNVPGAVLGGANLKKMPTGQLFLAMNGEGILKAMDDIMADDVLMGETVRSGRDTQKDGPAEPEVLHEKLFGRRAAIKAVVGTPHTALVDYASEVAAAKSAFAAMAAQLGVPATTAAATMKPAVSTGTTVAPAATASALGGPVVSIAGVRLVRSSSMERGLRPFSEDAGYAVVVQVDFPKPVISLDNALLETAVADDGNSLLPEQEWDRKVHFPTLAEDGLSALLELEMIAPGPTARGLKEVSGSAEYMIATATKEVDLGIATFAAGTTGTALGAVLEQVGPSSWDPATKELTLRLAVSKSMVKAIRFQDAAGNPVSVDSGGTMWGGESVSYTFRSTNALPTSGRVIAEVYDNPQLLKLPFRLENITLMGDPR